MPSFFIGCGAEAVRLRISCCTVMLLVVKTVRDADRGHQSQETLTQQWVVSGAQRRQRHPRSGEHTKESSLSAPSSRHRNLCIAEFWDSVGLPYTPMCRPQSLSTINNGDLISVLPIQSLCVAALPAKRPELTVVRIPDVYRQVRIRATAVSGFRPIYLHSPEISVKLRC